MAMKASSVIFCILLTTLLLNFATPLKCPPGTFLYTIAHTDKQFCIECQDGTFMSLSDHNQKSCRTCEEIKVPELEVLVSPCNKTHDAVIHCVDGYYRDEARNPRETGTCKNCTKCPHFTGRPCGTYRDTACCWDENYDVPEKDGVLMCIERPWFCRRGEYFKEKGYQCSPCPDNTFMPLDYHIQPECWKCRENVSHRPLHSVIIQPCNSTHAPVIRCEDGFFIKPNMGYGDVATGCSQCTDCSTKTDVPFVGRKCDGMEDTVCCPKANMTVIDTSKGPVCCPEANMVVVDTSKEPVCCPDANMIVVETPNGPVCKAPLANPVRCGKGQCPHQGGLKRSVDCAPCPPSPNADHSVDTGIRLGNADQSATVHLGAKETFSNDDHDKGSSGEIIPLYLFVGIVIGVVLSLAFYCIYIKFYTHPTIKQSVYRKRSRSEMNESTEPEDLGESDPLDRTISETDSTSLRHRQVASSSRETIQQQRKLSGCSVHLVTIDDHRREQCCCNESDLTSKMELCKFARGHESFKSAKTFSYEHLPEGLREDHQMKYIKAVRDLTVRLKVNHTSSDRPKNYPCHELRGAAGAGIKRFGTGLVFKVIKKFAENNTSNPCPCRACSVYPEDAEEKWAEFEVVTAAHVVYNNEECERMSCKLRFDDDDDFIKASSLNGRRVKETGSKSDFRIMHCITHDGKVSQELEEKIAHLANLRKKYNRTSTTELERPAVLISHQHALSKRISVGKATLKMDGDIQKWSYDVQACPGSCGAPVILLGTRQGSDILTTVHNMENESTGFYL